MDTQKLTALEFCIIVMWMHGWTISKIHLSLAKRHGKTEHAVRGIINKIPQRRQAMSREERKSLLERMKHSRIDDGMLPDAYFVPKVLASDQKKKAVAPPERKAKVEPVAIAEPDPKTRAGRREIKNRKLEAEKAKRKAAEEQARREAGLAPRGVESSPLEYLYNTRLLSSPEEGGDKGERANNAMRRYEAGVRLRSMLESIYGSGIKTPNYESAGGGGGGAGVVIHAVVAENVKNLAAIKTMLTLESSNMLEQLLLHGIFVWQIPSAKGGKILQAEIRDALDKVSIFFGMMPKEGDENVPKQANRGAVRHSNFAAREALARAQRDRR